jgi:hypothetical protein
MMQVGQQGTEGQEGDDVVERHQGHGVVGERALGAQFASHHQHHGGRRGHADGGGQGRFQGADRELPQHPEDGHEGQPGFQQRGGQQGAVRQHGAQVQQASDLEQDQAQGHVHQDARHVQHLRAQQAGAAGPQHQADGDEAADARQEAGAPRQFAAQQAGEDDQAKDGQSVQDHGASI